MRAPFLAAYTSRCAGGAGTGLEQFLPSRRTTFYGYGRQALAEALRRAAVNPGDAVLVPAFICREALSSLAAIGATPRFYAVDATLRTDVAALELGAPGGARAVLAVNYFGFPQPLAPFRQWCRARGAALIEDNAHGFLSMEGDVPLGRRGDLGVFSLRKTLALPNGAALVDNRDEAEVSDSSSFRFSGSTAAAERRYRLKAALKRMMELGGLRFTRAAVAAIRLARLATTGSRIPRATPLAETAIPQESCAPLALRLLARCDLAAERERRWTLYRRSREVLDGTRGVHPFAADLPDGVVPQGFPFRYTGDDPDSLVRSLWRRGVSVHRWPDLPSVVRASAPDHYLRVMLVQFLW